ncbi:MAG: calcium/sodium antiporter [Pseudomonadota bacterium]
MLSYILFFIGFVLLIKGSDYLVEGSSYLAKKMGISDLVIGFTIVSIGTSAPEIIISFISSFQGQADIAIGDILGSNIVNISLGIGIAAIIWPVKVLRSTIKKEITFSFLAILLLCLIANTSFDNSNPSTLSQIEGLFLSILFIGFLFYIIKQAKDNREKAELTDSDNKFKNVKIATIAVIGGLIALNLGAKWVIDGAVKISIAMGASQAFIGLTLVAIGTSLPEIVTCIMAALKRKSGIIVGNIIGSNILNILCALGFSAAIKEMPFYGKSNMDIFVNIIASCLLFIFIFIGKEKFTIEKKEGLLFVIFYCFYLVFLFFRG